jgi:hypothetical protein
MLPDVIIALILAQLPWEEESERLLKEYSFAESQWRLYTKFKTETLLDTIIHTINGVRHRDNGPSVIIMNDTFRFEYYYQLGHIHRLDGPACIITDSSGYVRISDEYYQMGKRHRIGGPAIIRYYNHRNHEEYWIDGIRVMS